MNIRTCPHCSYRYPLPDYFKSFLFKFIWSEWNCKNFNKLIKFNLKRRIIIAAGLGLLFIAFSVVKESILMNFLWWFLLIVGLLIGTIFIYAFDTFDKVKL